MLPDTTPMVEANSTPSMSYQRATRATRSSSSDKSYCCCHEKEKDEIIQSLYDHLNTNSNARPEDLRRYVQIELGRYLGIKRQATETTLRYESKKRKCNSSPTYQIAKQQLNLEMASEGSKEASDQADILSPHDVSSEYLAPPSAVAAETPTNIPSKIHEQSSTAAAATSTSIMHSIQEWILTEGGQLLTVRSFVTKYCELVRQHATKNGNASAMILPLDRMFIAGMLLHPQTSAYVWRWEHDKSDNTSSWDEHQIQRQLFEQPNFSPDEPFAILSSQRAKQYRMKRNGDSAVHIQLYNDMNPNLCESESITSPNKVPSPDCSWFLEENYQDYVALPILYDGDFKGAMAFCTRHPDGFTEDHIHLIHASSRALQVVLRLHTNDIILHNLTAHLEDQVQERTQALATANAQLEMANRRVQKQSQLQLAHFAMMSHEIRTPLNCIVGISSLLLEDVNAKGEKGKHAMPEPAAENVRMIVQSSDLLLAIVDDVLDYSKLAAGKVELVVAPTKINQIVQVVLESIRIKARQQQEKRKGRPMQIECHIDRGELPVSLIAHTDGRRLQQILYNLLGNAVKFGRDGGKVIFSLTAVVVPKPATAAAACDDDSRNNGDRFLQFSIKDYGPGIAKEEMEHIFQPFQQAQAEPVSKSRRSHANENDFGGTGLGLAITSKLVNRLGGTIDVESVFGEWTTFVVNLPLIVSASPKESTQVTSGNTSSNLSAELKTLKDLRVLIAEDNTINQKVLTRSLQRIGIAIDRIGIANNGKEAVDLSAKTTFDVIFMDLQMPEMDGLEATSIIKRRDSHRHIASTTKIIFLTAHALQEFQQKADDAGGDGFISKPFKLDEIRRLLHNVHMVGSIS